MRDVILTFEHNLISCSEKCHLHNHVLFEIKLFKRLGRAKSINFNPPNVEEIKKVIAQFKINNAAVTDNIPLRFC